jgi:two-component system sensor histidine kinase DctS
MNYALNMPKPRVAEEPHARLLWWLPRLAFLLFIAAVIALLWFSDKSEQEKQRATLISDILWLEQNLRFLLDHNEELLGRFDPQRIDQPDIFDAHARALISSNTGIYQVIWLDNQDRLRQMLPAPAGTNMVGEEEGPIPSPSLSRLAHSLGRAVYGPAYPVVQNDWQFEVHVPIFRGSHLAGTAVGIYSIRRLLESSVPWWLAERYRIGIADQANKVLGQRSKVDLVTPGSEYRIPFEPPGHGLVLSAAPYQAPTPLADRLLAAALVLLAVLVLASLWALRRHVQRRLAAEAALQTEVAFRKAMEDSLQTGMRALGPDGRISYVNPAFCRMVGYTADELLGSTAPQPYWPIEEHAHISQALATARSSLQPSGGIEMRLQRRNGERFDALLYEAPFIDSEGRHTGWMGSVLDITERKRNRELARQQEDKLAASARLVTMGEMASSLAHELNQPLSAISSYIAGCRNLIAAGTTCAEIDGALSKCQDQAQRAGRIIRRIYEFMRRHEPKSEPCDLEILLGDLVILIEADARRQQVRIVRDIEAGLPLLMADRVLLGQAVLNLIKNGIESMRLTSVEHRVLTVTARADEGRVEISISDRGCGISAEDAAQLFEPFYTTKNEGLGVGLNICRSVVEAHHGRLWFEANPEGGSIFHISLPIAPS